MASPVAGNQSLGKRGYEEDCDNRVVLFKKGRESSSVDPVIFENNSRLYVVLMADLDRSEDVTCSGVFRYQGTAVRALSKAIDHMIDPFCFAEHAEPKLLASHQADWDQLLLPLSEETMHKHSDWDAVTEDVKLHAESTVMKFYAEHIRPTLDQLSPSEAARKICEDVQNAFIGDDDYLAEAYIGLDISAHQAGSTGQSHVYVLCFVSGKHYEGTGLIQCLGVFENEFDIVQAWVAKCARSGFLSVTFRSAPPEESDLVSTVMEVYEADIKPRTKNLRPQASLNLCVLEISRQFLDIYDDSDMRLFYREIKCEWDDTDCAILM
jgi:hypothetical protein